MRKWTPFSAGLVGLSLVLAGSAFAGTADDAVERAAEAARNDDHTASIEAWREAFELEPALADSFAADLAWQLTWNDQPTEGSEWFLRRLDVAPLDLDARMGLALALSWADQTEAAQLQYKTVHVLDPGNLDAMRGNARMLAWMDRLDESRAAYEATLAEHPDDLQTRLQHAQVVNWSGDHFEAAHLYDGILVDHPGNAEALVGQAQALRWVGREGDAMKTIQPVQNDARAADLYRDLTLAARPALEFGAGWSEDSDDLQILQGSLSWIGTAPIRRLGEPRARLSLLHANFQQPGQPDLDAWGFRVGGRTGLTPRTTIHAYAGLTRVTSDGPVLNTDLTDDLDWTLLTWDAWWTWLARRDVRVDLATDRNYVETTRSLGYRTSLSRIGASADWRVRREWTLSALLREGFYDDGNRQTSGELRARWQRNRRFTTWISPKVSGFVMSDPKDRGYWNPEDFASVGVDFGVSGGLRDRRWTPRLEISTLREWEDGNGYGVLAVGAGLAWRISRDWELDLGGGTSNSRLSSSSGYGRDWAALTLRWRY